MSFYSYIFCFNFLVQATHTHTHTHTHTGQTGQIICSDIVKKYNYSYNTSQILFLL